MLRTIPSVRSRNPRLEGWMYKKTKGVKGLRYFQRRWVVLYPDSCVIAYYKKRTDCDKEQLVRNNMGTTVMPWAAAGIIPIDNIESVFPTHKDTRFDIAVSQAAGKPSGKTYQWKCKTKLQRDLWVEAIALVHEQLQKSHLIVTINELDDAPEDVDTKVASKQTHQTGNETKNDNNTNHKAQTTTTDTNITTSETETKTALTATVNYSDDHDAKRTASKHRDSLLPMRQIGQYRVSTSSSNSTGSTRKVVHTKQGSEVIGRLLTTDRFAPLRPPPSLNALHGEPTISNTVGRSLVGADHMPHSGESAMSDSDTNDDCDTDETDPDDDDYPHPNEESDFNGGTLINERNVEQKVLSQPINERSGTLLVDHQVLEANDRKHALRLKSIGEAENAFLEVQIGWLFKLGRINKSWRKRFFVLTHGQIRYYTNATRTELKGSMPLLSTKVNIIDAAVFKPPTTYCLEVSNTNRRLVLACTNIEEQEVWRRSLQKCIISSVAELPPGLISTGSGIHVGGRSDDRSLRSIYKFKY
jgi:hypothetical protein